MLGHREIRAFQISILPFIIKQLHAGYFSCFLSSTDFFQKTNFSKNYFMSSIRGSNNFLLKIRPVVLSGLIWVQTVCKSYPQTTLVGKELNRY